MKTFWQNPLLEDFVARDIDTVDLVARAPHIGNELLLLIGEVLDLGPCVALSIGVDLQHVVGALASHEPATTNDVVLVTLVLEDVHVTETVLTELIASLNETRDEVAGLETNGALIVVAVVAEPDGPALLIEHGPELVHDGVEVGLGVGVDSEPSIEVEGAGREVVEWSALLLGLLGLGLGFLSLGLFLLLLLLGLLGLGLLLLLGLLSLRLGGDGHGGLAELDGSHHSQELGLVDAGGEPTDEAGVGGAVALVKEELEAVEEVAGDDDIGEGDLVADEVGVVDEVVVEDLEGLLEVLLGGLEGLGVGGEEADDGAEPVHEGGDDLGGAPVDPLINEGLLVEGGAHELGVGAEAGDVTGDGGGLEDGA